VNTSKKLTDEWLLSYAAGALTEGHSIMVASHMAYHEDLQQSVADAEAIGGALIDELDPSEVPGDMLERLLERLDESLAREVQPINGKSHIAPQPLIDYLGCDLDKLKWRLMGPGIRHVRLWSGPNDERLWLLRARGGVATPEHGHNGDEWTLVLKGAYTAAETHFTVGDMETADQEVVHQPVMDKDEECICLVLTTGLIQFKSPIARMLQPIIGL
jgi:putative transcriptional regulator